jgi:hypothetical protein
MLHSRPIVGTPGDRFEQQADRAAADAARDAIDPMAQMDSPTTADRNGDPLPVPMRSYFESRLNADLSGVRVHADTQAARSAAALGADAYTLGRDVVFGAGQYAPHTPHGRGLLAHELTHVVQQKAHVSAPALQPRLKVWGDAKDIKAFMSLLEPASGFTLERDKDGVVSIKSQIEKPPSVILAAELMTIIADPGQDAEIHVGRTYGGVHLGKFADLPGSQMPATDPPTGLLQEIRIDQMLAFEKGAPGEGTASLAHEIIENYLAHDKEMIKSVREAPVAYQPSAWHDVFSQVHPIALENENLIEMELGHPGPRHYFFELLTKKGSKVFLRGIEDHETFFLVWEKPFGTSSDEISNVRRVSRIRVAQYVITGVKAGRDLPDSAQPIIDKVAQDMKQNPTASARIDGQVDVFESIRGEVGAGERWAGLAEMSLTDALRNITPNTSTPVRDRMYSTGTLVPDGNKVVITLDKPDI